MAIVIGVLVFIYGLIIGSFLNVCIYRIPRHNFFSSSTSFCPECHHKLAWYDLFPLFSYIFLGGRCRYCKERISFRYPFVEASNAVLWLACYLLFDNYYLMALSAILSSVILVVAFIDLDTLEIPNGIMIVILVIAAIRFVLSFFVIDGVVWWEYLVGAVCVSLPFFIIALVTGGGIGGGDIKLCFVIGFFLGWKNTLLGTLFGVVIAGVVSVVLILKFGKGRRSMMPLAPPLAVGYILAMLFGDRIIDLVFPF